MRFAVWRGGVSRGLALFLTLLYSTGVGGVGGFEGKGRCAIASLLLFFTLITRAGWVGGLGEEVW